MNQSTKRSILRWIHIIFALPLIGYVYGPPEEVMQYAPMFRYGFMPVVLVSGLWMWKGEAVKRFFSRRAA